MICPNCEKHIGYDFIESNDIEPNEVFEAGCCSVLLRLIVDESTYLGAQQTHLEIADD